jgi:hypothetical protein
VGFVVDKVALGQVFFEYFGFPCKLSFHQMLHHHHHLSSGAGTRDQLVADVTGRVSLTSPQETKKKVTECMFHILLDLNPLELYMMESANYIPRYATFTALLSFPPSNVQTRSSAPQIDSLPLGWEIKYHGAQQVTLCSVCFNLCVSKCRLGRRTNQNWVAASFP